MHSGLYIRIKIYTFLAVTLLIAGWLTHLWIVDRKTILRTVYPLKAQIAKLTVACHGQAPWVDNFIKLAIDQSGGAANQVAYIDGAGKITECISGWTGVFPWSDKITGATRFRYASNTKLITAAAVLKLVNSGALNIDATLAELFPELTFDKDKRLADVSVKQLLTHRAGFDRERVTGDSMFKMRHKPWCPYDLSKLNEVELSYSPGDETKYSNLGYCLLGAIIEKVTLESYKSHVDRVYALESHNIKFVDGPYLDDEPWYDLHNELFYTKHYYKFFDFHAVASAAGLSGNAVSLASVIRSILSNDAAKEFFSAVPEGECDLNSFRGCYGYAFYRYRPSDLQNAVLMHEGYLPGSSSLVVVGPQGDVLVWLSGGRAYGGFMNAEEMLNQMLHLMLSSDGK